MSLLTKSSRDKRLKYLGYKSVSEFQKVAFKGIKSEQDGKYGTNTDNALRTYYNVKKYTTNFTVDEIKCRCGKCNGFPTYAKKEMLQGLQSFRDHYGKPITVTCGMRCNGKNSSLVGASSNSKHLTGYAVDFYQKGVTDTLANRKIAIKYAKTLSGINYAYGNGWCIYNYSVNTPNMGNAMHIDFKHIKPKTSTKSTTTKTSTTNTKTTTSTTKKSTVTNAEKLAKTAESLCWAYGTKKSKWTYKTGNPTSACKKAMNTYGYKSRVKMSDCGNFMNTVVRKALGKKINVFKKSGSKFASVENFKVVQKGTSIDKSKLKRGDIVRYRRTSTKQHIMLYLGNGKWAEAGRETRFGVIRKTSKAYGKKYYIEVLRAK